MLKQAGDAGIMVSGCYSSTGEAYLWGANTNSQLGKGEASVLSKLQPVLLTSANQGSPEFRLCLKVRCSIKQTFVIFGLRQNHSLTDLHVCCRG